MPWPFGCDLLGSSLPHSPDVVELGYRTFPLPHPPPMAFGYCEQSHSEGVNSVRPWRGGRKQGDALVGLGCLLCLPAVKGFELPSHAFPPCLYPNLTIWD